MIIEILYIVLRFVLLMAIQVLVLNNVQLGGMINPFLYVMFLLTLPIQIPNPLLLVIAFVTGATIDIFQNTMGMHASACLLMAYMRPGWLKMIAPRDGYEADASPGIRKFGLRWFIVYCSVMLLIHHILLFNIEMFRFSEFFNTLTRAILSSLVTLVLIVISQYLTAKPTDRNLS
jgi:rod shape-determining protein MreD